MFWFEVCHYCTLCICFMELWAYIPYLPNHHYTFPNEKNGVSLLYILPFRDSRIPSRDFTANIRMPVQAGFFVVHVTRTSWNLQFGKVSPCVFGCWDRTMRSSWSSWPLEISICQFCTKNLQMAMRVFLAKKPSPQN